MKRTKGIWFLFMLLILISCEKVTDYYLGFNLQPEFTENTFEEGMNIFGLLRPDHFGDFNKSFVYVQQNWPVLEINDSSFTIIKYVDIQLIQIEDEVAEDTISFPLLPPDSSFTDTLYRPSQPFNPVPGNIYRIQCRHESLPTASGETRFPPKPEIVPNSLIAVDGNIEFEVAPHEGIKMLDVYVSSDVYKGITGRYVTNDSVGIKVFLSLPGAKIADIVIYGYDANLASYYANSNTSLNFNKFRTTFSTLEEGFGVFGSLNKTDFRIDLR